MSKAHPLSAFEESFLEDGIVAVCACGWKSQRQATEGNAIAEHTKHVARRGIVGLDAKQLLAALAKAEATQ